MTKWAKCDLTLLSALVDGDLSPRKAERLRAHVAGCAHCRKELAALEALRGQLAQLPALEPAEDGWLALSRKLQQEKPAPRTSWRRWVLAPAFGAVLVAGALWLQGRGPSDDVLLREAEVEFRGAEAQYQRALAKLDLVVAHAKREWPAERVRQYDAARAALETATAECQKLAHANPADSEGHEVLFAAYRKQIHFYEAELLR